MMFDGQNTIYLVILYTHCWTALKPTKFDQKAYYPQNSFYVFFKLLIEFLKHLARNKSAEMCLSIFDH